MASQAPEHKQTPPGSKKRLPLAGTKLALAIDVILVEYRRTGSKFAPG